ncbi:hypothetical protein A2W14_02110 [Candidatus Gottesmanbacteria bacterium RBG_16_37_8]|uniref:Uncharacterized protein n=1 Tax=Candidatus Gottesmanbacteria bacterium RBG_16_37_8 TaxID=1798371 RepID=A0A1F5YRZ2_9BACT|nr:MAG: hypothetical protein A2W14_02110 [Candidatus Gottesmanbacteria bacterium RBG_16_37_8]
MNVIIDCDALLGLFNIKDFHHQKAVKLIKKCVNEGINIFILPTTLAEFALLSSYKIGVRQAKKAVVALVSSDYLTLDITTEITKEAVSLYEKQTSKEESLFDCLVMVATEKLTCDGIFSFDKGYRKNGFSLLEDIV